MAYKKEAYGTEKKKKKKKKKKSNYRKRPELDKKRSTDRDALARSPSMFGD